MTKDEIDALVHAALDFAKRTADHDQRAARGGVNLRVCTVQEAGEPLEAATDRALRARDLVPAYFWTIESSLTFPGKNNKLSMCHYDLPVFSRVLPKIRVTDVDQRLGLMSVCGICSRAPTVGTQITVLPSTCSHAFHSHCIFPWLLETNLCPVCEAPASDHAQLTVKMPPPTPY